MLKAIIFDMDGVIINSEIQHAKAAQAVYERLGISLDLSYFQKYIGSSTGRMAKDSISEFNLSISEEKLLSLLVSEKKAFAEKEGYISVPGVVELIKRISKTGIRMAIASSSSPKEIDDTVKALKIGKYFDKLISSSLVENPKPASDVYKFVLSKLGISPKEALVIEDTDFGIQSAKSAGIACVGYVNPDSGSQSLRDADVLLESFEGLNPNFFLQTLNRVQGIPIEIASTRRLIIRELTVKDIPELYPIYRDPDVRKYIDNIDDYLEKEMEKQKAYIQNIYSFYGYGLWGVFSKTTGGIIGRCGIENQNVDGHNEVVLSYLLDSKHWGYGYALECCNAVLDYAANELNMNRIIAIIDRENSRSIKTAQNLGMRFEKEIIYKNRNCHMYIWEK